MQLLRTSAVLDATLPKRRGEVPEAQLTINHVSQFSISLIFGGIKRRPDWGILYFFGSGLVLMVFCYRTSPLPAQNDKT